MKNTNGNKKLNDYNLQNAKATVENSKGGRIKIVAWFSLDLPTNYDPGLFNGLPGLITNLKITEENFGIYYALNTEKISLKSDLSIIIPFNDLEVITNQELQAIFAKMNGNFKPD